MKVYWIRCQNNTWCPLNTVNLRLDRFDNLRGIYIIWYQDNLGNPRTVRVGQGFIRERLTAHRSDPQIQAYASQNLYVTWTNIPPHVLDGVERYLGETLIPLVGYLFPTTEPPIPVNLPW